MLCPSCRTPLRHVESAYMYDDERGFVDILTLYLCDGCETVLDPRWRTYAVVLDRGREEQISVFETPTT